MYPLTLWCYWVAYSNVLLMVTITVEFLHLFLGSQACGYIPRWCVMKIHQQPMLGMWNIQLIVILCFRPFAILHVHSQLSCWTFQWPAMQFPKQGDISKNQVESPLESQNYRIWDPKYIFLFVVCNQHCNTDDLT